MTDHLPPADQSRLRAQLAEKLRAFADEGDGRFSERPYCDDYEGLTQALREAAALLVVDTLEISHR